MSFHFPITACRQFVLIASLIHFGAPGLHGQDAPAALLDAELQRRVADLAKDHQGEVAVAIEHLETGKCVLINADHPMPTASLIKLPLLIATYRAAEAGQVDLDSQIALQASDKAPGSGVLTEHFSVGATLPLRDYLRLMIRYSDNTATNVVIDQVGLESTTAMMESMGYEHTKLHSKVYQRSTSIDPERSRQYGLGSTTAAEMVRLLKALHDGQLANEGDTQAMIEHLLTCDDDSKLAAGLPPGTRLAHKSGAVSNCRTDAGILYTNSGPVAVCVLTNGNEDQSWNDRNAAHRLCAAIGQAIVAQYGGNVATGPLQQGADGKLVEALQRTLNQRLQPSPDLAVDGDFGPATRAAVEQFQRQHGLPSTGVVNEPTWGALGELIETDEPVPTPEEILSQVLPVEPQPPLDGPPIVTCKAWVIGDSSGQQLWGSHVDTPLEAASTTKIMTAYVVLQLAESDPAILNEMVGFSQRADDTTGSSCGLRQGERIRVEDLLYGLLLPSGNDAAVALAEHFGSRLREEDSHPSAYDAFIAAMNAAARELGLSSAHYTNPHGLPDTTHVISAADLLQLTVAASRHDLFRKITQTRQYGCRVQSEQGYRRNVLWKNTNRLLEVEGYLGVKTGTTSAAGACLVSCARRGTSERYVVVLGSSSSAARYADTRNLLRWSWNQTEDDQP